jgi:hypothetical protein
MSDAATSLAEEREAWLTEVDRLMAEASSLMGDAAALTRQLEEPAADALVAMEPVARDVVATIGPGGVQRQPDERTTAARAA